MLALGLLFMIVAAAVTAGAIYDGGEDATVRGLRPDDRHHRRRRLRRRRRDDAAVLHRRLPADEVDGPLAAEAARAQGDQARQRESVSKIEEERAQLRAENEALQERLARERRPDTRRPGTTAAGTSDRTAAGSDDTMVDHRPGHHHRRRPGRPPAHRPDLARGVGHLQLRPAPRRSDDRPRSRRHTGPGPGPGRWHVQAWHRDRHPQLDDHQHRAVRQPARSRQSAPAGRATRAAAVHGGRARGRRASRRQGRQVGRPGRAVPGHQGAAPDHRAVVAASTTAATHTISSPADPRSATQRVTGRRPRRRPRPGRRPRPLARPATTARAAAPSPAPRPPPGRRPGSA